MKTLSIKKELIILFTWFQPNNLKSILSKVWQKWLASEPDILYIDISKNSMVVARLIWSGCMNEELKVLGWKLKEMRRCARDDRALLYTKINSLGFKPQAIDF